MPLVASLASLVATVRARVLDRGACGPLADRHAAAAARRKLAGHLLDAALLLRIGDDVGHLPPHITEIPVRHPQGRYQASSRDFGVS